MCMDVSTVAANVDFGAVPTISKFSWKMVTNMKLDKSCETNINQQRQSRELASNLLVKPSPTKLVFDCKISKRLHFL